MSPSLQSPSSTSLHSSVGKNGNFFLFILGSFSFVFSVLWKKAVRQDANLRCYLLDSGMGVLRITGLDLYLVYLVVFCDLR